MQINRRAGGAPRRTLDTFATSDVKSVVFSLGFLPMSRSRQSFYAY
jgi:hypothetical protein